MNLSKANPSTILRSILFFNLFKKRNKRTNRILYNYSVSNNFFPEKYECLAKKYCKIKNNNI